MIKRILNLPNILAKKSCFLFGPRQTGKTSLIKEELKNELIINLLDSEVFFELSRSPGRIKGMIAAHNGKSKIVIIDEIQRLPELLNEVHLLIEEQKINFLLTGSSTRKLRSGGYNLLGGRARSRNLHPFVSAELGSQFDLLTSLNFGLIPSIYLSDSPTEDLRAYCGDYLQTEIAAEGLAKNLGAFSRFLEVAAATNTQMVNYTKISNDSMVPRTTVMEYFQILRDTLIGYDLLPWNKTVKRKPISTSKFYFFDTGISRILKNGPFLSAESYDLGEPFETFIFHELNAYKDYYQIDGLHYWRSKSGYEVDFILGNEIAIEVKSTKRVQQADLKGLKALAEETTLRRKIVVCREKYPAQVDGIDIMPWTTFLQLLWAQEL